MTDSKTANKLLRELRRTLEKCRRTEEAGFDTYWITAVALDTSLDELEQAIAATLDVSRCRDCEHIVKTSNPMTTSGYWCVENDNPRDLDGFCDYFEQRKGEIEEVG